MNIMMHQARLWVNWCIFLHQVRVCSSRKKHSAFDQAVAQLEDLQVPGQAVGQLNDVLFPVKLWESWYTLSVPGEVVGQLKDGSILGQLVGELRMRQLSTRQQNQFSSIGIHFRQSFNQNLLPDVKAQLPLTNLNNKIMNLFEKNDEIDPSIRNSFSGKKRI